MLRCLGPFGIVAVLLGPGLALAGPIDADRLTVKRMGGYDRLTFRSHDDSWTFPDQVAPDDGPPGGIFIEFLSAADAIDKGISCPQLDTPTVWRVSRRADASIVRFKLRNPGAPNAAGELSAALLHSNGMLRLVVRTQPSLLADGPQGAIGLRMIIAGQELCALFSGDRVVTDRDGAFVGRGAKASDLPDCSDQSLLAPRPCGLIMNGSQCGGGCPNPGDTCVVGDIFAPSCHCVGATSPCGDTAPMCNGTCPDGSSCAVTSQGTETTCGCVEPGGCEAYSAYPTCGGACAAGKECHAYVANTGAFLHASGCACVDPGPCGCSGTLGCPADQTCVISRVPNLCFPQCQ